MRVRKLKDFIQFAASDFDKFLTGSLAVALLFGKVSSAAYRQRGRLALRWHCVGTAMIASHLDLTLID